MISWDNDLYAPFFRYYFSEVKEIVDKLDFNQIYNVINILIDTKNKGGRVFVLGLGGSASNASHFVTDLRKLCEVHAYAPTDNVSEITARANDESFNDIFWRWLDTSRLANNDCVFVLSVSGGNPEVSSDALAKAIEYAHRSDIDAYVLGICGDPNGALTKNGDYVIQIPVVNPKHKYQHAESFQGIIWHFITSHPDLRENEK